MSEAIILAGNGHGAHSAYLSLAKQFPEIHLYSQDEELLASIRSTDRQIHGFLDSPAKYCVCAGYGKLIDKKVLNEKIIINTHPSLLPKYRGMHSVVWAMLNGEEEIGFTVHLMNEFMDDGDIISQHKVRNVGQTSKDIMDDFDRYVETHLGLVVKQYIAGEINAVKQDKSLATWVPKRNLDDCILDFTLPNTLLRAIFRALVRPYPLPRIIVRGLAYEVTDHEIMDVNYYTTVGRVINIESQSAYIKTIDGILLVKGLLDVASGKPVMVDEVLKIGQRL